MEESDMTIYALRVEEEANIHDITDAIRRKGFICQLLPECNPITYWIETDVDLFILHEIPGIVDFIRSEMNK